MPCGDFALCNLRDGSDYRIHDLLTVYVSYAILEVNM
jgi:hypothetical protein